MANERDVKLDDHGTSGDHPALLEAKSMSNWAALRLVSLTLVAIVGWLVVIYNGAVLSSTPFRQLVNLSTVRSAAEHEDAVNRNSPPLPPDVIAAFPRIDPDKSLDAQFARFPVPQSAPGQSEAASVNIERVRLYFGLYGVTTPLGVLVASWFMGLLSYTYTNLALLACFSSLLGSLASHSILALRREPPPDRRGRHRMLYTLTGTTVLGLSLGFTMFMAVVGGVTVVSSNALSFNSPAEYVRTGCFVSFLCLLSALFPDWFLKLLSKQVGGESYAEPTGADKAQGAGRGVKVTGPGTMIVETTEPSPHSHADQEALKNAARGEQPDPVPQTSDTLPETAPSR